MLINRDPGLCSMANEWAGRIEGGIMARGGENESELQYTDGYSLSAVSCCKY